MEVLVAVVAAFADIADISLAAVAVDLHQKEYKAMVVDTAVAAVVVAGIQKEHHNQEEDSSLVAMDCSAWTSEPTQSIIVQSNSELTLLKEITLMLTSSINLMSPLHC